MKLRVFGWRRMLMGLLLVAGHATAEGPRIVVESLDAKVRAGEVFEVLLRGDDFAALLDGSVIDNVSGGQKVVLDFDPKFFEFQSLEIDSRWTFLPARKLGNLDSGAGVLSGIGFGSFPATTEDSFSIGSARFRSLKTGEGQLGIVSAELVGRVAGISGRIIPVRFEPAVIQVSPIPEPAMSGLMVGGLAVLVWHSQHEHRRERSRVGGRSRPA